MARPKKQIPEDLANEVKDAMEELSAADQLVPLIFEKDSMALLLALQKAHSRGGLPFSIVGKAANLGRSQKLADLLSHMADYALVEQNNGNYVLTDLGLSAAGFAHSLINMINLDSELSKKSPLAGRHETIQIVESKSKELLEQRIRETG